MASFLLLVSSKHLSTFRSWGALHLHGKYKTSRSSTGLRNFIWKVYEVMEPLLKRCFFVGLSIPWLLIFVCNPSLISSGQAKLRTLYR